jgi:Beta-lactamase enzyme family
LFFRALLIWILAYCVPAAAQNLEPNYASRAREIVEVLALKGGEERVFAPSFLAEVPVPKLRGLAEQLIAQNGSVTGLDHIEARSATDGDIVILYARASVRATMVLDAAASRKVIGLLITGVTPRGDSAAKLERDIRALPGEAGLVVARLDGSRPLLAINMDQQFAIGSEFKLWILAEAARQVARRERKWNDVIRLGPPSLPSGITQDWPKGAPMTLHSLATLMISISDNGAADTLLFALERSNVGDMVSRAGHSNPHSTLPLLSTVEAFGLKTDQAADLRAIWDQGEGPARQRMLDRAGPRLALSAIDRAQFAGAPRFINSVEWFASPGDSARLLDWLRLNGGPDALSIMAVSAPLPSGDKARFRYVGYKGGSEIGVIAMSFLLQTRTGAWFAVSGAWNDAKAPVDPARFDALVKRAIALIPN